MSFVLRLAWDRTVDEDEEYDEAMFCCGERYDSAPGKLTRSPTDDRQ